MGQLLHLYKEAQLPLGCDSFKFLSEHNLFSIVAKSPQLKSSKKLHDLWKTHWMKSEIYLKEFNQIKQELEQDNITLLGIKGIWLLHNLYSDASQRFMSDIDVVVLETDYVALRACLLNRNYHELDPQKLKKQTNKIIFIKKGSVDLVIEVHKNIFINGKNIFSDEHKIKRMSLEEHYIFMIYHLAQQHSFLKLFWLFDLVYFYERYNQELDWNKVSDLAEKFKIKKSYGLVLWIYVEHFKLDLGLAKYRVPSKLMRIFITENYLLFPWQNRFSYLMIKHLIYDSFLKAIKYDFQWLTKRFFLS